MHLQMEYIFSDEMLKLFDCFTSLTEVRIAFHSLSGEGLYIGKDRSICSYCSMRRRSQNFRNACLAADRRGRDGALERGGVNFYRCHAGLGEAVVPVFVGNVPIGYVMIGQFRLEGEPAECSNLREAQALEKLPVFSDQKVGELLRMFQLLISHITNQSLVGRRDFDLLEPLVERMRKNPAEVLSLADAAKYVGLSMPRLSHLFTSMMGIGFKRFQRAQRLELADRLMEMHPDWRVSRVAEACGFEDPLYFSRVYKKQRGIPPSKAVQRFR